MIYVHSAQTRHTPPVLLLPRAAAAYPSFLFSPPRAALAVRRTLSVQQSHLSSKGGLQLGSQYALAPHTFLIYLAQFDRHLLFAAHTASFLMRLLIHKYIVCKFKIRIDLHTSLYNMLNNKRIRTIYVFIQLVVYKNIFLIYIYLKIIIKSLRICVFRK